MAKVLHRSVSNLGSILRVTLLISLYLFVLWFSIKPKYETFIFQMWCSSPPTQAYFQVPFWFWHLLRQALTSGLSESGVSRVPLPHKISYTYLNWGGGQVMPTTLQLPPATDFQTFLRLCTWYVSAECVVFHNRIISFLPNQAPSGAWYKWKKNPH